MRRAATAALLLAACAAPAPPPPAAPPPAAPAPAPTATALAVEPPPAPPEPPPPPTPALHLAMEPAFRLDRRVFPPTRAAFLADLQDRTAWNTGGLGLLSAPLPPVPGHPAPKVIIDVTRASGALKAADAQRVMRSGLWGKVVECYGHRAYKDQKLRGMAALTVTVASNGKVTGARATKNRFPDQEIPRCLGNQIRNFAFPKSRGKSTLAVEIQIGHGDEPVPPPPQLIVAGEGELTPAEMGAAVEAARPSLMGCFEAAQAYAPELWGRLGLRFHVDEKGKADEVFEAESRFPDERVSLCVLRAARQIAFPKPRGGDLRFVVPLRFWSDRSPIPARQSPPASAIPPSAIPPSAIPPSTGAPPDPASTGAPPAPPPSGAPPSGAPPSGAASAKQSPSLGTP